MVAEREEAKEAKTAEAAKLAAGKATSNDENVPDPEKELKVQPADEKKGRTNEFAAVPVGMTVTAGGNKTSSRLDVKKKTVLSQVS